MKKIFFLQLVIFFITFFNYDLYGQEFEKTLKLLDSALNTTGLKIDTIKELNELRLVECLTDDYLPNFKNGLKKIYYARIKTQNNRYADFATYIVVYSDSVTALSKYNSILKLFETRKFVDDANPCFKGIRYYTFNNFLLMTIISVTYKSKIEKATQCKLIYYLKYE